MTILEINSSMIEVIEHPNMPMYRKIEAIWALVGKLSPDPNSGNIKKQIPNYNSHLVRKVGRQKLNFTSEQKLAAREILRKLGLI